MPRLLPPHALDAPSTAPRWAALAALACALTAWHPAWADAYDTARGLIPTTGEVYTWDADEVAAAPAATDTTGLLAGLTDPADAATRTLTVPAEDLTLDLAWQTPLTIGEIRIEVYTDAYGTGQRLGIAADTTTAEGTDCINARLTGPAGTTALQTCTRADRHGPVDMAAFLGKEPQEDWTPDHLFITQTANLDPVDHDTATQVDYYGFGLDIGDSYDTGVWGPNWTWPMRGENYQHCNDLDLYLRIDDLHLTDRYSDPAEQRRTQTTVHDRAPAFPDEGRLLTPACTPVLDRGSMDPQTFQRFAAEPFQKDTATPLAGWSRYNTALPAAQPMRTATVVDVRSCDTTAEHCTADREISEHSFNSGPGGDWIDGLLGVDCVHAIGRPCPGLGPGD
jgi:hypothetical protein